MKKLACFLIDRRYIISAFMLVLTVICGILALKVPVTKDRTVYLADSSNMKQGLSIMNSEFPEAEEKSSIRVMFDDLSPEQIQDVKTRLESIPDVSSVTYDPDSEDHNKDNHTLFVVNSAFDYRTDEERAIEASIQTGFPEFTVTYRNNDIQSTEVPLWLLLFALALMTVILFVMCNSWLEPVLFLVTIGIAVVINMGTNIVFPYIDEVTLSMGPIIQLVLSMDYSIILMNRYLQEKKLHESRTDAMKAALAGSMTNIASSSLTTAVGLLALVFLSFKLGPELGIVLAKGVIISMICVFTLLPLLILFLDKWIDKTKKSVLRLPVKLFASFSLKTRRVMPFVFIVLFIGFFILQGYTRITFMEKSEDPLTDLFPKDNTVVLIYNTADEDKIESVGSELEKDELVTSVMGYYNTLGKAYNAKEMSDVLAEMDTGWDVNEMMIGMLYVFSSSSEMTLPQLFEYISNNLDNPLLSAYINDEAKEEVRNSKSLLDNAITQFQGPSYSRFIITSDYPEESEETLAFIDKIRDLCDSSFEEDCYLIGNSVMADEMNETLRDEYLIITLITAVAIFLVVLVAFRKPIIPLILTLIVQCSVFITIALLGLFSGSLYYLAMLIVQGILMGATIDYGIVFCNAYRESRKSQEMADAMTSAYEKSIHTIMTSGSILVLVLAALGIFAASAMISEVSSSMSIGALVAIILILFVLPGLVACFDRFIKPSE